jgi:hypothetical protein
MAKLGDDRKSFMGVDFLEITPGEAGGLSGSLSILFLYLRALLLAHEWIEGPHFSRN